MTNSLRRRFRNEPSLMEPRDLDALLRSIRYQTEPRRTSLYLHVPLPDRGLAVRGQALPNLPAQRPAVFATGRQTQEPSVRADLIQTVETPWVVEGSQIPQVHRGQGRGPLAVRGYKGTSLPRSPVASDGHPKVD